MKVGFIGDRRVRKVILPRYGKVLSSGECLAYSGLFYTDYYITIEELVRVDECEMYAPFEWVEVESFSCEDWDAMDEDDRVYMTWRSSCI